MTRQRTIETTASAFDETHRAATYANAREAVALYLMAHDIPPVRAYGAATDLLGEDLIDTIERG